ncbi:uncharacterized protein LOC122619085 [Drosophila teissieri]|uniref:uncharacterized protein LOC122619085 n=1 Tax=Drosophila teissieri TaxID=7243 RepID=UPI001CBA267A|nr:uncharacterized protein LOC122619085 [Drosophila teissieri]
MPVTANQTPRNRKDVKGQIAKQTPTCKVGYGLGRRISLTGFSRKVNNYQNYKLREEGATTWLNCNAQNIAVQKKHIKNLGIDVNNFYGGPVIKKRPKLSTQRRNIYFAQLGVSRSSDEFNLRTETNAPEGDTNNMASQQEQPNNTYSLDNKVSKLHKIMNPEIVKPIDKCTLDKLRKSPRRLRESGNSRVHKRYEKKLSKPLNSPTNRRTVVRMPEENVEYDSITLCDFGETSPRNYPEETDSEKWYSSDPDSDDTMRGSSHIDDDISTSEEENVQSRSGYESDISFEEPQCSEKEFTAEYNRPQYNIKPVDSDIFTSEKGELHSRRTLLAEKEFTLKDEEGSDILTSEEEDVQSRMEYESEEDPQCSEKEFTAEYNRLKYNIKPVDSDIFTSEISSLEEGDHSEGHEASELTINSEEDISLLSENDFLLDNMDIKNVAQYGEGNEIMDRLLSDDNPNWKVRPPSTITFHVTTPRRPPGDASQLMKFLLRSFKKLKNEGHFPWMDRQARVRILQAKRPSIRDCEASFLLYVFSGLGKIRPATMVKINISFSPEEKPSPYLDILLFYIRQDRLEHLKQTAMKVDRYNHMRAKRSRQLKKHVKRIEILHAYKKVEKKRISCTEEEKRRINPMLRMVLRINPLFIICSVTVITASFLVFHELYYGRPKPKTLWESFLLCFGI